MSLRIGAAWAHDVVSRGLISLLAGIRRRLRRFGHLKLIRAIFDGVDQPKGASYLMMHQFFPEGAVASCSARRTMDEIVLPKELRSWNEASNINNCSTSRVTSNRGRASWNGDKNGMQMLIV